METRPQHVDEASRLQELRSFEILDTETERAFDDIAELAAHIAGTAVAFVSLMDSERQWFKAKYGSSLTGTPREISFCDHAILANRQLVVADAQKDARFVNNPLVLGEPRIRFYAGTPLVTAQEQVVGTLCVIDQKPREITPEQLRKLDQLARQVVHLLELRRASRQLERSEQLIHALCASSGDVGPLDERIQSLLELGCEFFGLDVGILARVEGDVYSVEHVVGDGLALAGGERFPLGDSFCSIVMVAEVPLAVSQASETIYVEHPAYSSRAPESYIGVRFEVDGQLFGTLNFSSSRPRALPFMDVDVEAVRLMSVWLSGVCSRQLASDRRERVVQVLEDKITRLRTLEGLIPICSWCREIRDESGAWHQLEAYIEQYGNAEFSHGVCPKCVPRQMSDE